MTEIPLTQGKIAFVDDADAPHILRHKWFAMKHWSGKRWYAATKIKGKRISMHHFLTGFPMTDHENTDSLDNQRHNLRPCTNQTNQFNRSKPRTMNRRPTTSRFKGVTWNKKRGKWIAQIEKDGKHRHLGYFPADQEELAAAAYRAAATELFGEFARF